MSCARIASKHPIETLVSGWMCLVLVTLLVGLIEAAAVELGPVFATIPVVTGTKPDSVPEYNAKAAYLLRFTADTGTNLETQLDPAKTDGAFWTNAFIDAAGK